MHNTCFHSCIPFFYSPVYFQEFYQACPLNRECIPFFLNILEQPETVLPEFGFLQDMI